MEVGWSLRWRVEGGRERSDWRGIVFIFYFLLFWVYFLLFCFLGGSVGGFGSIGLCICMDGSRDYGSVVVVVVVGNRCPRISG